MSAFNSGFKTPLTLWAQMECYKESNKQTHQVIYKV